MNANNSQVFDPFHSHARIPRVVCVPTRAILQRRLRESSCRGLGATWFAQVQRPGSQERAPGETESKPAMGSAASQVHTGCPSAGQAAQEVLGARVEAPPRRMQPGDIHEILTESRCFP
jgi:hypothetical protein